MAARRHVTNKLRSAYARASKTDRGRILDEVIATTGMGRSTARRALTGPVLPDPGEQVDRRRLRAKQYSDDSRSLLEHVWVLMGCPCGKYLTVMLSLWMPLLTAAGDLDKPFAMGEAIGEIESMSAETIDRYLDPARRSMQLRGISTTKPYLNDVVARGGTVASGWPFETELSRATSRLGIAQAAVTSVLDRIDLAALDRSVYAEAGLLPGDTLRSLDALHIAAALRRDADVFVSYDERQITSAHDTGLTTATPG